ncbi:hypothetical protein BDN72DRAFT_759039 [Pluteus cervinus]|uniref:Uncharacterized protein n=1 Tax=Pluteus cervinus TaxID=181527 RepID=A0ACD3BA60_9AGAR|nr:hypothetical protein BDN72DRAFT_759039 [Pluteus cervinus]
MSSFTPTPFVFLSESSGTAEGLRQSRGHPNFRGRGGRGERGGGGWRGRGGRGAAPKPRTFEPVSLPGDRELHEGLSSPHLSSFDLDALSAIPGPATVQVSSCKAIGSYNWLGTASQTIVVPGSPPIWKQRPMPFSVPPDTGIAMVDPNGYHFARYPILPAMIAVEELHEGRYPWNTTDFITDRNNIRKLLRWISKDNKEFRIDLHLVGERTIIMGRWEKRFREPSSGYTYGLNYKEAAAYYPPECKGSESHHRIIHYTFGGLTLVVRCKIDACHASPTPQGRPERSASTDVDQLADALAGVRIDPVHRYDQGASTSQTVSKRIQSLTVLRGGSLVPQSSLIELTTRAEHRRDRPDFFDWKEGYPHLYLSQTPYHIIALHQKGTFIEVQKEQVDSNKLIRVHRELEPEFKKLRDLLAVIQKLAIRYGSERGLSLVCEGDELRVYERMDNDACLPSEYLARFNHPNA